MHTICDALERIVAASQTELVARRAWWRQAVPTAGGDEEVPFATSLRSPEQEERRGRGQLTSAARESSVRWTWHNAEGKDVPRPDLDWGARGGAKGDDLATRNATSGRPERHPRQARALLRRSFTLRGSETRYVVTWRHDVPSWVAKELSVVTDDSWADGRGSDVHEHC